MRGEAPPELISRARVDRAAFAPVYDHYLARVYAFCRNHTATREQAEDMTAVTFERAMTAIVGYEDRGVPFSHWLIRIAANAIIDDARKQGRTTADDPTMTALTDESQIAAWEEAYWLRLHVESLPLDQRRVVTLRFYEDLRFLQIGQRMGRSEGAVKQLLRRALKHLAAQIRREGEGSFDE